MYPRKGVWPSRTESESWGWICPTSDLHWNPSLFGLDRTLLAIHEEICSCGTATTWTPNPEKALERRTSEWHSPVMCRLLFRCLRKYVLRPLCVAFADCNKPFLLETHASKLGSGVVLLQNQSYGQYHPAAYVSWSLTSH